MQESDTGGSYESLFFQTKFINYFIILENYICEHLQSELPAYPVSSQYCGTHKMFPYLSAVCYINIYYLALSCLEARIFRSTLQLYFFSYLSYNYHIYEIAH